MPVSKLTRTKFEDIVSQLLAKPEFSNALRSKLSSAFYSSFNNLRSETLNLINTYVILEDEVADLFASVHQARQLWYVLFSQEYLLQFVQTLKHTQSLEEAEYKEAIAIINNIIANRTIPADEPNLQKIVDFYHCTRQPGKGLWYTAANIPDPEISALAEITATEDDEEEAKAGEPSVAESGDGLRHLNTGIQALQAKLAALPKIHTFRAIPPHPGEQALPTDIKEVLIPLLVKMSFGRLQSPKSFLDMPLPSQKWREDKKGLITEIYNALTSDRGLDLPQLNQLKAKFPAYKKSWILKSEVGKLVQSIETILSGDDNIRLKLPKTPPSLAAKPSN